MIATEPVPARTIPATLPAVLLAHAATIGDRVAIRHKALGRWREFTWTDFADGARAVGAGLLALGVQPGDRVAVHSDNRPEWSFSDLGIQGIGAATIGIYPTSPPAEVRYLLEHSEAAVMIAENEEQLDKTLDVWDELPNLRYAVVVDPRGVRVLDDPRVLTFDQLLGVGRDAGLDTWDQSVSQRTPDEVAIIVYTSGTTGPPKGAMLTFGNLQASAAALKGAFELRSDDEVLSYLPLCHIAERMISIVLSTTHAYIVNFGESTDSFANDLREVQPSYFAGVPRIWEKMLASVEVRMSDASWFKRRNYHFWMGRGRRIAVRRMSGTETLATRLEYRIGSFFLFRALRERLGLVRVEKAISGGAPVAPQVLEFFWTIGVPVREGYGQTENTGICTVNPPGGVRVGTVGTSLDISEFRIASDGEILTRSPATFVGYLNDPDATAATVDQDGWLHTGDIGEVDLDGYLTITDRKKDIIITAGGKNLSPSEIENRLKVSPYIREAVVIGDRRRFVSALICIDYETVGNWAARNAVSYTTYEHLASQPTVRALVEQTVAGVNQDLAQVAQIKAFELLRVELDHEDGQLTATQKVKRAAIADQFGDLIEGMYQ